MTDAAYPLLSGINTPDDLRHLPESELPQLARELRSFLVESVSRTGGHLSASLGTIELTVALHYVFNTPYDRLTWDVGHQSYGHKILTGRREAMASIRKGGGIAGFPKRDESEYDTFGVGHSSTSISAALGMAYSAKLKGENRQSVAVIGDGAMTAGMAFEALNNAGDLKTDMLVILNDNDMSISPNVGGLSNYFGRIISSRLYANVREGGKKMLEHMPPMMALAKRAEEHMKGMVMPGTLFEELGFQYFGPTDGHDLPELIRTLRNLKSVSGPKLLHVITRKGKGYGPAEQNPLGYHGVSTFDPKVGIQKKPAGSPTYSQIFGDWLCDIAAADERIIGITPAMIEGSGMQRFQKEYPERCLDVGIAEQHAVTLAAGFACEGMKPVMAIYSTFLQRAYDQLIHDVALQNLPVLFAIDRAGLVGADGPTHAGAFDLSYMRCIPNMTIMTPADEDECRQMLYTGIQMDSPSAVRYPRGTGPGVTPKAKMQSIDIGKGETRRTGKSFAILNFGSLLSEALAVAEKLDGSVANMRFVKPLDTQLINRLADEHELLVTLEENVIAGGAGSAVSEYLRSNGKEISILHLGLPDENIEHGDHKAMLKDCGLHADGIEQSIQNALASLQPK